MSTALLKEDKLERLLKTETLDDFRYQLASTDYEVDIKASEQKFVKGMRQVEVLEDALQQNFIRQVHKIRSILEDEPAELVNLLLRGWDIYNIKTVIRGKHANLAPAEIMQNMFWVGSLERSFLEELVQEADVGAVVEALIKVNHTLVLTLREKLKDYFYSGNLLELEVAIDKWHYQDALRLREQGGENFELMRKFLQAEIDYKNIITALRLGKAEIKPSEALKYFLSGGLKINREKFSILVAQNETEGIVAYLRKLSLANILGKHLETYRKTEEISVLERAFETQRLVGIGTQAMENPFGFGILMSYLRLKYNELVNLRIILRAVEFGIPEEMVRGELVFA